MKDKFHLGYVPYLDGLRALAIWLVMGYHGLDPLSNRLALVLNGWMGVDVFFVISGFLITSLLVQEREECGTISLKGFYIRRSLRIIPAFVFFLALTLAFYGRGVLHAVLVSAAYLSDYDLALGLGTISGAEHSVGAILGHTWSLSVEEQFYLLWPISFWLSGKRALPLACFVVVAVSVWRVVLLALGDGRHDRIYTAFDTRLDVLMIGCIAAMLWASPHVRERIRRGLSGNWTAALLAVALVCSAQTMQMAGGRLTQESFLFWVVKVPLHAALVAFLILAMLVRPDSMTARVFSNRILVWVGKLSYSLYLWHHFAIQRAEAIHPYLGNMLTGLPYGRQLAILATGGIAIVFALTFASASYYVVEKPFLRMKKRWEPTRSVRGVMAVDGNSNVERVYPVAPIELMETREPKPADVI
jgi:peptidoglycan/LPS O-acetylase OafA/YrhL